MHRPAEMTSEIAEYRRRRAGLIRVGLTFASFARRFGYKPQTVYSAASGRRAGVKASLITRHIDRIISAHE